MEYEDESSSDDDSDLESVCSTVSSQSTGDLSIGRLYVRYPKHISKEQLQEHFNVHGYESNVLEIHVFLDKATHSPSGSALVKLFPASVEAEAILKLNQTRILGKHKIVAKPFKAKSSDKAKRGRRGSKKMEHSSDTDSVTSTSAEFCKVHVSSNPRLADFVTDKHLREHFRKFQFTSAYVFRDRSTKKSKGFAFITFSSQAEADKAIRMMNGRSLLAQFKLHLNYANPKKGKMASEKQATAAPLLHLPQPLAAAREEYSDTQSVTSQSSAASLELCKVFVRPSPLWGDDVTDKHLQKHFRDFEFTSAYVVKSRNVGFVSFSSQSEAESAITRMKGTLLAGKFMLHLEYAKAKRSIATSLPNESAKCPPAKPPAATFPQAKPGTGIVIDNLDVLVTENELKMMIAAPISSIQLEPTAPGVKRARVTLSSPADVETAKRCLDGKQLLGRVAKVSLDIVQPAPLPTCTEAVGTVKVTNLPFSIDENTLRGHFQRFGVISSINIVPKQPPFAYVNFSTLMEANNATASLNETMLAGMRIRVKLHQQQAKAQSTETPARVTMQPVPPAKYEGERKSSAGAEVQQLKLLPDQWNSLMKVGPLGTSVYKELKTPFESNPNVNIQQDMEALIISFNGVHDAVCAAYKQFSNHFNKEINIQDRLIMKTLLCCHANLPQELSEKHGVEVSGFHEGSVVIKLNGPSASVGEARSDIDSLVRGFTATRHRLNFNKYVLASASKRMTQERVRAVLEMQTAVPPSYPELCISSCYQSDHSKAANLVTTQLLNDKVHVSGVNLQQQFQDKLVPIQERHMVSIEGTCSGELALYGFIAEDLRAATQEVLRMVESVSMEKAKLAVTPDQAAYLHHVREHDENFKFFLHSLPAKVYFKPEEITLLGSAKSIQETQEKILNGPILSGVHVRMFSYHCHVHLLSQIEQCSLAPLQEKHLDFRYTTSKVGGASRQSRNKGKEKGHPGSTDGFTILVFSKDPAAFGEVCAALSAIAPTSKHYPLHPRALDALREIKPSVEQKYNVRILDSQKKGYTINGLSPTQIQACSKEIEDHVNSTVEITKCVVVDENQWKYFRSKNKFEELKSEHAGVELLLWKPKKPQENFSIQIKGTLKRVETVHAAIMECPVIAQGVTVEKFQLPVLSKRLRMWSKQWMEIKNDYEQKCDLSVIFSWPSQERPSGASIAVATFVNVTFEIVGSDEDSIRQVKEAVCKMESQDKTLSVSSEAIATISKGMSELLQQFQPLAVNFYLERKSHQVVLTAPVEASEDLQNAEDIIQKFIGNRVPSHVEVTSTNPVVSLIFSSRSKSVKYLAAANTIARPHDVSVRPLKKPRNGLLLSGSKDKVEAVKPLIHAQVLQRIEQDTKQVTLEVESIYGPVFTTGDFSRFESKLQDDFCVICTYPRLGKKARAVCSTIIQPSATDGGITMELCKGNLVLEQVDVIVNAANEELKHIGGVAKSILDVGGSSIQAESDEYVKQHGKLATSRVACLSAGKLPCKKIIHAVGPRWRSGSSNEEQLLYFTVLNSLQEANKEGMGSIALPAISCGVFGVPDNICARASIKAVCDFAMSQSNCYIHTVKFVLFTDANLQAFVKEFNAKNFKNCPSQMLIQPVSAVPPSTGSKWLWKDDHGSFLPHTNEASAKLAASYLQNPRGAAVITVSGKIYSVNFSTMMQTDITTGVQREVKFTSGAASGTSGQSTPQWYYTDDNSQFSPYTPPDSQKIEQMFQASSPGLIFINGSNYTVDFSRMCQVNVRTGYKRPIQRRGGPAGAVAAAAHTTPTDIEQEDSPYIVKADDQKKLVVTLLGPRDVVDIAKTKVEEKLKASIKSNTITLPPRRTAELETKLKQIAATNNVVFSFEEATTKPGQSSKVLKLKGLAYLVQNTTSLIQEEIINYQLTVQTKDAEIEIPPEWQPQTQTSEVFPVARGSAEWNRVEQKFKATLASNIIQITRIQNTWVWENYSTHKKRMHIKNNGRVNEKELFHGTRGNDPKVIYEGEDGFDMRYSASGMWGQGNYFAVNASYSNSYAHTSFGYKEMFLVRVLTGDSHQCGSNSGLRMPPLKSSSSGAGVQLSQLRYDTVTGTTNGSQVFMTYDNDKAYPAYLIKYQ